MEQTLELPVAITDRIRQIQAAVEKETVKGQALIHGLCEGQLLAGGITGGKWTLSPDASRIQYEGSEANG